MDASPYCSTWGPLAGPIRMSDAPPAIGVIADPDAPPMPIGTAYPVGHLADDGGPVVLWRMEVRKAEVLGRWVCDRRQFVPTEDWAERQAMREG